MALHAEGRDIVIPQVYMKTCSKCKETKPFSEFNKGKDKHGLHTWCKACNYSNRSEWNLANRERNQEQRLYATYRLRPEELAQMLVDQGNTCLICDKALETRKTFHIDHDHSCCPGKVSCGQCIRGILCSGCNTKVWWFELYSAKVVEYLEKVRTPRVVSEPRKRKK